MSAKGSISLKFNGQKWRAVPLGERVLLLETPEASIQLIHSTAAFLQELLADKLLDLVPAYHSIALFTDMDFEVLLGKLSTSKSEFRDVWEEKQDALEIPICYEAGPDIKVIAAHTKLPVETVIERHLLPTYSCAFVGFTPGFIYAEGLDMTLSCPRKSEPRKHVPAGSVGIGGSQTGIYSLASPGGWNILGRTPLSLFDSDREPPILLPVGQSFRFRRISQQEFDRWEN